MDDTRRNNDFLKPNPFVVVGLLFALATPILMLVGFIPGFPNLGVPGVFTLLLGGLFLLIGGNDQITEVRNN